MKEIFLVILAALLIVLFHPFVMMIQNRMQRRTLAKSLEAEIKALFDRYMSIVGNIIEKLPNNTPLNSTMPVKQNYFAVFDSNSHKIGLLKEHANLVIKSYTDAKGHLDTFILLEGKLNRRQNMLDALNTHILTDEQISNLRVLLNQINEELVGQTEVIRESQQQLVQQTEAVLETLEGISNELYWFDKPLIWWRYIKNLIERK